MLKWNRHDVQRLLDATIEYSETTSGMAIAIASFSDRLMNYELYILESENAVFLSADPAKATQALPFFEISLPCAELRPFERMGMPIGLGIYSGSGGPGTVRFSITRREDGAISLSGAYSGLTNPV